MAVTPQNAAYIAAGTIAIGLAATIFMVARPVADPFAECRDASVARATAKIGGPFELVAETGAVMSDKEVISGPSLLYFGYSYCPDVCPTDNARNAEAIYQLDEMGVDVLPVFISVDSARDTPELLKDFTDAMHPRMLGLTGSEEQVRQASRAYRTYYKVQNPGDAYTLIDHSTQSYLMFPDYGFVEAFGRDVPAADMAEQLACFVEKGKASGLLK